MLLEILNKVLVVCFFMSCLVTTRHTYYFIQALLTSTEEEPIKYRLTTRQLIFLCLAISYVLSVIFTGIKI